jgi:hypothetical protein
MIDRNELNRDLAEALQEMPLFAVWVEGNGSTVTNLRFRVFPSDASNNERLISGGVLDQNTCRMKTMKREFAAAGSIPLPNHHIIAHDGQSWRVDSVIHSDLTDDMDLMLHQHE